MFESFKYSSIPFSGEKLVDMLPNLIENHSLDEISTRMGYWKHFSILCRAKSTDHDTSIEEKEIWARSIINSLDAIYKVAEDLNSYGVTNLSAEFIGILEAEFMKSPNPLCIKRIAMEIGAMNFFDKTVVIQGTTENESSRMESLSEIVLEQIMGDSRFIYEKTLCKECRVNDCQCDYYWRQFLIDGEENEKYSYASAEDIPISEPTTPLPEITVPHRILEGNLSEAQPYLEALIPQYVNEDLNWRKGADDVTNYHAYWVALILSKLFPRIKIQLLGDHFGINNLRNYSTEARLRPQLKDTFITIFRNKGLTIPNI